MIQLMVFSVNWEQYTDGKLNLISTQLKTMLIYNWLVSLLCTYGRWYSARKWVNLMYMLLLTSAEKGKTHTVLACVSASGNAWVYRGVIIMCGCIHVGVAQ